MSNDSESAGSSNRWMSFRGRPDDPAVLAEKADAVRNLIVHSLTLPFQLVRARTLAFEEDRTKGALCDTESAALFLRLVEEISCLHLSKDLGASFNDELLMLVSESLLERNPERPEETIELLVTRFGEYANYSKWISKAGESQKGTLFWEYANTVAAIYGIGKDAAFNLSLTSLLLSSLRRWCLAELLVGDTETHSHLPL